MTGEYRCIKMLVVKSDLHIFKYICILMYYECVVLRSL